MLFFHQLLASHELGGAGSIALHLASDLQSRAVESHVWISGEGAALHRAKQLGLSVHTYDARSIFARSKIVATAGNLSTWWKLRSYSPGLIHVHSPYSFGALQPALVFSALKSVVHVHIEESKEGLRWALKHPPDLIITCANYLLDYVQALLPEYHRHQKRVVAIPNPVDISQFYPGDRRAAKWRVGAPQDLPLALMLANLATHKGQEVAIRAIADLKKSGVNIVLWLAGIERGSQYRYTSRLKALCGELRVSDCVQFLGHRDDAADLLRAADVFLLPSTHEGLPLSILEAQATKVPVLAAPTAGIPEVISDGETGFLIQASDINGYSDRIKHLIQNADLYHYVVERSHQRVLENHTWTVYADRLWQVYQELIYPSKAYL
jgi:glycosyltransferase involved in cell wall biosynthesis